MRKLYKRRDSSLAFGKLIHQSPSPSSETINEARENEREVVRKDKCFLSSEKNERVLNDHLRTLESCRISVESYEINVEDESFLAFLAFFFL